MFVLCVVVKTKGKTQGDQEPSKDDGQTQVKENKKIPVGTKFFSPHQTGPGVKWPGHGVSHIRPSSAEIKEGVELYLYCPCGPAWPFPAGEPQSARLCKSYFCRTVLYMCRM
jgi:hypothetical protein